MYAEVTIKPADGGFGLYQCERPSARAYEWEDDLDLLSAMRQDLRLYELGVDDLPDGIKDIRGSIEKGEPDRVFAQIDSDGHTTYTGIDSSEERA